MENPNDAFQLNLLDVSH